MAQDLWQTIVGQSDYQADPNAFGAVGTQLSPEEAAAYQKYLASAPTGLTPYDTGQFQRMFQQNRLVQTGNQFNDVLKQQQANTALLQATAAGKGPNVAGDEAQQRALGLASSGNVAPGARAALLANAANTAPMMAAKARGEQMLGAQQQLTGATSAQGATLLGKGQQYGEAANLGMRLHESNVNAMTGAQNAKRDTESENAKNTSSGIGGMLAAAGGAAMMMSDERAKEDVRPLDAATRGAGAISERDMELMRPLTTPEGSHLAYEPVDPYEYRYKPAVAHALGEDTGPRAGLMAHELEESPYLRHAVSTGPDGMKRIDSHRLLSGTAAAAAGLDKRLSVLEAATRGTGDRIRSAPVEYVTPRAPNY